MDFIEQVKLLGANRNLLFMVDVIDIDSTITSVVIGSFRAQIKQIV